MGGEGNRGRKGMRKKGMRKAVAVINSAFFLYLNSFHLSRNLLPLDQVCISHSLVPSRPVPSFSTIPFFPRAFTPSPSLLISYHHAHLSHFLSFPFTLPPPLVHPPPFYHLHQHQVIPALTHDSSYLCRRLELVNFFFIWVVYSSFI